MKNYVLFLILITISFTIDAQPVIFTGDGDGSSWEDPQNWRRDGDPSLPGVPQEYDDILISDNHYVYFNGLGVIPLDRTYGSLELRFGAHLFTQGDFHLSGNFIVDPSSTFNPIITDIDLITTVTIEDSANYFFNGNMEIAFVGYVPQIGDSFQIIEGLLGSCATPTTTISYSNGFETTLGSQCEFNGLSYVVTELNYTTAISWDGEGNDSDWDNPANWDPNGIPPAGSTIIINLPGEGGLVRTNTSGIADVHTITIGRNNTLELNTDLLMTKYIYLKKQGTFLWNKGKIYSKDENVDSSMQNYGHLILDSPGLKELDTNFRISTFFEDVNHNQGNFNINNGIMRMFNFNSYNINNDNITIGYTSGDLHEFTISVVSTLKKTTGNGTSSINLTKFINYGDVISESGTLAFNENLTTGEFEEYINGNLVEYIGSYGGSGNIQFPLGYVLEGELSPGSSPGTLTVIGDLTTSSEATFNIEIDGPNAGTEYDQIIVTNEAILDGKIKVTLSYLPTNDASFEIVTAANLSSCNFPAQVTGNYNGTDYTFNVVCQNNTLYLNGPGVTLSDTNFKANQIKVYPNPTSNKLFINTNTINNGQWKLYNQLGQLIKQGRITREKTEISLQDILSGIYFIKIQNDKKSTITKKIIKA